MMDIYENLENDLHLDNNPGSGCDCFGEFERIYRFDSACGFSKLSKKSNKDNQYFVTATLFPAIGVLAQSFNTDLAFKFGCAVAKECISNGSKFLVVPALNVKKCCAEKEQFKYFSEDPLLCGNIGQQVIKGYRECGVIPVVKEFVFNGNENDNILVDERALEEIYLEPFRIAFGELPDMIICQGNKINNQFIFENKNIIQGFLQNECEFGGVIATVGTLPQCGLKNVDFDLKDCIFKINCEQNDFWQNAIKNNGKIAKMLDKYNARTVCHCDLNYHDKLSEQILSESVVLLKNENILPMQNQKILFISSNNDDKKQIENKYCVNPFKVTTICLALQNEKIDYIYANLAERKKVISSLCKLSEIGIVVLCVDDNCYDNDYLQLIIERAHANNKKVVAVLQTSNMLYQKWFDLVDALLYAGVCGQNQKPIVDILFGKTNPSGRLAATIPFNVSDGFKRDEPNKFKESIFVGYRFYSTWGKSVAFPFGFGLGYSRFEYSNIKVSSASIKAGEQLTIKCTVKNVGPLAGKEVVQLYIEPPKSPLFKAKKALVGFDKVELAPMQSTVVAFVVKAKDFAYYNISMGAWHIETGIYKLSFGKNVNDVVLSKAVQVVATVNGIAESFAVTAPVYYDFLNDNPVVSEQQFKALFKGEQK